MNPNHVHKPHGWLTDMTIRFAQRRESFTTGELCKHLGVSMEQARGVVNAMFRDRRVVRLEKGRMVGFQQASQPRWKWMGKPARKLAPMVACLLGCLPLSNCQPAHAGDVALNRIGQVESRNNHSAVGDNGKARGAHQMHQAAWSDVDKARKKRGLPTHSWASAAHDPVIGPMYAAEYLEILRGRFRAKTGRLPTTTEEYALWNLGAEGFARRSNMISRCPRITRRAIAKL